MAERSLVERVRPRFSIPARVFVAFALVIAACGAVAATSLAQHARSARTLRLLHEGYLPLALTLGEAKATQAVFGTLVDRVLEEKDTTATRSWLQAARRVRPTTLRRALVEVEHAKFLDLTAHDRRTLDTIKKSLDAVRASFARSELEYNELFHSLETGDDAKAAAILTHLRTRERGIQRQLRIAFTELQDRIAMTSAAATEQERQAALLLGVMALLALAVGVVVTAWSQRVLKPIPLLHERVAAVARGDLSRRLEPRSDDELGRLTSQFEHMVEMLALRDARLREAAEAELRTKARLLQAERLAAMGHMAAHIAHEVRNPLSSIGLNVEMLEEELASSTPETRALMKAIHKEIDRLADITEEYLTLARLPAPRLVPDDIGELAASVAEFVRKEMDASGIMLALAVEPALPQIAMDEPQLRQAFLNLLRNAREAMSNGGNVTLEVTSADGFVIARVQDEGPGIPAEQRERIFDLFYTTKPRGSGLGLSLTQRIVVAHGGEIRCYDNPGRGTTFEMRFPLAVSASEPAIAPPFEGTSAYTFESTPSHDEE